MKYVLDASVAVKCILPEPDSPKALALRDDFRSGVHELIAPDTLPVEIAHALTRAERRNLLQHGESINRLSRVLLAPPTLYPYLPLLSRATGISSQARIGIYDCLWYAIRIGRGMLDRIKYIAAYQSLPVAAVTYYASIHHIEPYGNDGKYRLVFAEPAKLLPQPIPWADAPRGLMLSPRYTSYAALLSAKKVTDLFASWKDSLDA